jgi:predicted O-linked N-acetylglucosamine transferase (SPINDLY family)
MASTADLFALARQYRQAGDLRQAESLCRQVLRAEPGHAECLHLLGTNAYQNGNYAVAADLMRQAVANAPTNSGYHADLGLVYLALGQQTPAVESCEQALRLAPDLPEAHNNLAAALLKLDRAEEAISHYRKVTQLRPGDAVAHYNLGNALTSRGQLDEAVAAYRRALQRQPDFAEAHNNLGNALTRQRRLEEAVAAVQRTIELRPDVAEGHNNLGNVLLDLGRPGDAEACIRRALQLRPDYVAAHYNLGNVFRVQGRLDDSIAAYTRALDLQPDYAAAHNNLGNALRDQGRVADAVASYQQTLHCDPNFVDALNNLGNALRDQGRLDEADDAYRRALQLNPDLAGVHSNLLLSLQNRPDVTLARLAAAHDEFERALAAPLRPTSRRHENSRDPERRLRIGLVSPDLFRHPVGSFTIPFVEQLDHGQAEVICYSDRFRSDELTERFRAAAATWRQVYGWSDEQLAEQIRADGIDILFDLAGHTACNRLLVFARNSAPVQVTWAGYVGTTGLSAMDYLVADRFEVPPGAEVHYAERVLRMPDGYVCYDPPAYAPAVGPLPALQRGRVTFGSFNAPAKIGPEVIAVWAEILRRLPAARLVLKYRAIDDPSIAGRLTELFARHGVAPDRIEYRGWSPVSEFLGHYAEIDIALDPFPYNGGLTTIEALWMGVPVITCPGETFAGRHSLSHLSNVGLTETIAQNTNEYVELAIALANDLPRLAGIRAGLRQRVASSPLCDGKRFADQLLQLLRNVWREWVESQKGGPELAGVRLTPPPGT